MNTFISKFISSLYNFYFFKKILFLKNLKLTFSSLNYYFIDSLFFNSYYTWNTFFNNNFWITQKNISKKNKTNNLFSNKSNNFITFNKLIKTNFIVFFFYNNLNNYFTSIVLNFFKNNINLFFIYL